MQFHEKMIDLISRVFFCLDFFKFSGRLCSVCYCQGWTHHLISFSHAMGYKIRPFLHSRAEKMAKNNEGYTHLPRHRPTTLNPLIQRPQQLNDYYYYWMLQTNGHGQQKTQPLLTQDIVALQNIKGQTHDLLSTSFHHHHQQLKLLLVEKVLIKSTNFLLDQVVLYN